MNSILVRSKVSGLLYRLFPRQDGSYYICSNFGGDIHGQVLNGPLSRILNDYPLEQVKE